MADISSTDFTGSNLTSTNLEGVDANNCDFTDTILTLPFALGRKNGLFSYTPKGAKASTHLYSIIETAKANGLEPYHYLRTVYRELPKAQTLEDVEALLPDNIDITCHSL